MDIGLDFDGTVVKHAYPEIGDQIPGAIRTLRDLTDKGHRLILFTMRSDRPERKYLTEAVDYLRGAGVDLFGIQRNPGQDSWTSSPKAYADVYIDDSALGCPCIIPEGESRYVDWSMIRILFKLEPIH